MRILTESELRSKLISADTMQYEVENDVFVTPSAKEYLKERGITLVVSDKTESKLMSKEKIPTVNNKKQYVDYETGKFYFEKPEAMTHLYSNVLVKKNHPRIQLRGSLDKLQAIIMKAQTVANDEGNSAVLSELSEILSFVREILGAEVTGRKLGEIRLFGYDAAQLRDVTHNLFENFGIEHTLPDYRNGRICTELNFLRTAVRETELYAVNAFSKDGVCEREDILEALNRLSSAVYIVYCNTLTNR